MVVALAKHCKLVLGGRRRARAGPARAAARADRLQGHVQEPRVLPERVRAALRPVCRRRGRGTVEGGGRWLESAVPHACARERAGYMHGCSTCRTRRLGRCCLCISLGIATQPVHAHYRMCLSKRSSKFSHACHSTTTAHVHYRLRSTASVFAFSDSHVLPASKLTSSGWAAGFSPQGMQTAPARVRNRALPAPASQGHCPAAPSAAASCMPAHGMSHAPWTHGHACSTATAGKTKQLAGRRHLTAYKRAGMSL